MTGHFLGLISTIFNVKILFILFTLNELWYSTFGFLKTFKTKTEKTKSSNMLIRCHSLRFNHMKWFQNRKKVL